jgi:hypothetical protein
LEQRQSDIATTGHGVQVEAPAAGPGDITDHNHGSRKKLGFMNKLKEEIKVIPSKLHIRKEKDFVGVD